LRRRAPAVFIDDGLIGKDNQYLHVPYNWVEDATIYRVRPNDFMASGHIYRGYKVIRTKAVKKEDGWYWQLELEDKQNQ